MKKILTLCAAFALALALAGCLSLSGFESSTKVDSLEVKSDKIKSPGSLITPTQ